MNPDDALSFGAHQAILSGRWDRYLFVLSMAIRRRQIELSRSITP